MTQKKLEEQEAKDDAYLRKENMKRRYKLTVENEVTKLQIRDSGRVHYSTPQRPFDVPAELEVVEEDARDHPCVKYMKPEAVARGIEVPTNAANIRSLMYRGGKKQLLEFSWTCRKAGWNDTAKTEAEGQVESVPLLQILSACTSLEELYIKGQCGVGPFFVEMLLVAAPHLQRTLKVLSLSLLDVVPEALPELGGFKALERLDLYRSFSGEHFQQSFDDNKVATDLPYDEGLVKLVESLPKLKRIDIGFGGGREDESYLYEYMLSHYAISDARYHLRRQGGRLTMDAQNQPEPWSSKVRKEAARQQALVSIMNDKEEDGTIREMAEDEARACPACKKPALKRCTGCKRSWFCDEKCQRVDYQKKHKKICKEKF